MHRRDALKAMAGLMAAQAIDLPLLVGKVVPPMPAEIHVNPHIHIGYQTKEVFLKNGQFVRISWEGPEFSDVSLVQVGGLENDPAHYVDVSGIHFGPPI